LLFDIGQQPDDDFSAALDQAEDRRFFFQRACRARARLSVGARPGLFFDRLGMACVPGDEVYLVAFNCRFEPRLGFEIDHPGAQLDGHLLDVILVEVEFFGDLLVRQVESHQVEAQHHLRSG
jgi:hypothetical protein